MGRGLALERAEGVLRARAHAGEETMVLAVVVAGLLLFALARCVVCGIVCSSGITEMKPSRPVCLGKMTDAAGGAPAQWAQ